MRRAEPARPPSLHPMCTCPPAASTQGPSTCRCARWGRLPAPMAVLPATPGLSRRAPRHCAGGLSAAAGTAGCRVSGTATGARLGRPGGPASLSAALSPEGGVGLEEGGLRRSAGHGGRGDGGLGGPGDGGMGAWVRVRVNVRGARAPSQGWTGRMPSVIKEAVLTHIHCIHSTNTHNTYDVHYTHIHYTHTSHI